MKSRKGFGKLTIGNRKFLFNWAITLKGPTLIMYNEDDIKIEIPYEIWDKYPNSEGYTSGLKIWQLNGKKYYTNTWHGKHKKGPEWGGWGKREAREMYFKYIKHASGEWNEKEEKATD